MDDLQNIGEFCVVCNVPGEYASGNWSLDKCRKCCASCRSLGKSGIYKFDIAYTLHQTVQKLPPKPTGKKATAVKRYGRAVASLTAEGKSQREIADILGISPTTVCKVRADLQRHDSSGSGDQISGSGDQISGSGDQISGSGDQISCCQSDPLEKDSSGTGDFSCGCLAED